MSLSHAPSIVRNGLILCLDAANSRSYPGTGTTWTDLSGNGNNGTLENSPVFNSANNGYFEFNGTTSNRRIIIPNNTIMDTQTPSVEVWVKINSTGQFGFWFEKGVVNTQYSLFLENGNIRWRQNIGGITNLSFSASANMNTTSWYQVVGTYTSGSRILYINGNQVNSDAQAGTISTNNGGASIGVYGGFSGSRDYYYNGNLSICRVYNKALTLSEIRQNYNATKGRYGL